MGQILTMPSLSPSMEEGVIESWAKNIGDNLESGDVLANIETDKAVVEYEVLDEGFLRHLFVEPGNNTIVGAPIAIITEDKDEDISALIKEGEAFVGDAKTEIVVEPKNDSQAVAKVAPKVPVAPPVPEYIPPAKDAFAGRLKASPLALKMTADMGIDITKIRGSGPNGRIIKNDVLSAKKRLGSAPAIVPTSASNGEIKVDEIDGDYEFTPLTKMRKTIAKRLVQSKQEIPHFYLTVKVAFDKILEVRKQINEVAPSKISVNDMIIKSCGVALMSHPLVNSRYTETGILTFKDASVGFAVATPEGLVVPIVRSVNTKGLNQIAEETKDLATRGRDKKLKLLEFSGGTFGTSNLGMMGVEQFTAIVNPPQACNLAIASPFKELVLNSEGKPVESTQLKLTLSCDHRVVDGAVGAAFLKTLREVLENPFSLML